MSLQKQTKVSPAQVKRLLFVTSDLLIRPMVHAYSNSQMWAGITLKKKKKIDRLGHRNISPEKEGGREK